MVKQDIFTIGPSLDFELEVRSKVPEWKVLEDRVKHLFDVEFSVRSEGDELELQPHSSAVRFKLAGGESEENLDRAKEYITGVCCPGVCCRLEVPIFDLLEENEAVNTLDSIEKETSAYLTTNGEGYLEICGSKMAVALATSSLEKLSFQHNRDIARETRLNNCKEIACESVKLPLPATVIPPNSEASETEEVWKKRDLPPRKNDRTLSRVKECSPAVKRTEGKKEPCDEVKETESKEFKDEGDNTEVSCSMSEEINDNEGSESSSISEVVAASSESEAESEAIPVKESLRDFAIKLGYSEAEVTSVLAKLGPKADKNSLLHELVKTQNSQKELEDGSSVLDRELKVVPNPMVDSNCLRPIVVDGSNVAMSHGNQQVFSCRGIGLCVDWFLQRGHRDIKVFVPQWRKEASRPNSPIIDQDVLTRLNQDVILFWTPSRTVKGRRIVCYDDRYIVKLAAESDGIIVSNDNFRDLQNESPEWKKVIEQRLLMYSFVSDRFMPPDDPHGRHGPKLDEFLRKGCGKNCPYGRRCTYGNRCKFLHPERNSKSETDLQTMAAQFPEPQLRVPEVPYGEMREACVTSRPGRPLPPLPDMPAYLVNKPLPPTPDERSKNKPLPLPPQDAYLNMLQMFPATRRNNNASITNQTRPASDPLPANNPCFDGAVGEHYGMVMPRRGSVPQLVHNVSSYPEGFPSLPPATGHAVYPPPPHPNMACPPELVPRGPPDLMARGLVTPDGRPHSGEWRQETVYGAVGLHPSYSPHFAPAPNQQHGYPSHHWSVTPPYSQAPAFNPHAVPYHFTSNQQTFHPGFQRGVPYRGGYYRTRGVPTDLLGGEVTDGPGGEGKGGSETQGDGCLEELRIKAYEQLSEVFPDDVEKILGILEKNPTEADVEKLTQMLLDEQEG